LIGHINNGIQAITPEMMQGWIREVSRNFARANRGEPLGQYYNNHDLADEKEVEDEVEE